MSPFVFIWLIYSQMQMPCTLITPTRNAASNGVQVMPTFLLKEFWMPNFQSCLNLHFIQNVSIANDLSSIYHLSHVPILESKHIAIWLMYHVLCSIICQTISSKKFMKVCRVAMAKVLNLFFQISHTHVLVYIIGYHITKFQTGTMSVCSAASFLLKYLEKK